MNALQVDSVIFTPIAVEQAPRYLLEQKQWDVDAFLAYARGGWAFLLSEDEDVVGFVWLYKQAVMPDVFIDTIIIDRTHRSASRVKRVMRAVADLSQAIARSEGARGVVWATKNAARDRVILGRAIHEVETLVRVEV